jgi:conjugal transfer pilus assembly protein TraD
MNLPIDNPFRPAYEWMPSTAYLASAVVVSLYPTLFLLDSSLLQTTVTVGLMSMGFYRGYQGWLVERFKRQLRHLPLYQITADQMPHSQEKEFLGLGFRWEVKHTQRLALARKSDYIHLSRPTRWQQWGQQLRLRLEHTPYAPHVAWLKQPYWWNPCAPIPDVGGDSLLHGIGSTEEHPVWSNVSEKVGHRVVLGTTRVGKTRLCELLVTQDIRRGDVVIVFDPKGDKALMMRLFAEAKRAGRLAQLSLFHLAYPEYSARYNPIGTFARLTEVATRIANNMPSEGNAASFKNFVWKYVNGIASACVTLGEKPSYKVLQRYAENIEPLVLNYLRYALDHQTTLGVLGDWRTEAAKIEVDPKNLDRALKSRDPSLVQLVMYWKQQQCYDQIASGLINVISYEQSYFNKLVASLQPFLEKVTTGEIADLISPDYDDIKDSRPILDWMQVINNGGIVYVGLNSLEDQEVASAIGNAMFSDLTSTAAKLYNFGAGYGQSGSVAARKLSIHADEFNELIGDEFIPMVNKAGGAGYQVTAYTQTWSDVEARIGSAAKAAQIEGNFNNRIFLRVLNKETAQLLVDKLPEVTIKHLTAVSSVSDGNNPSQFEAFSSTNEDKITESSVPMLSASDLVNLPKGQAFAMIDGGQLYKLRLPLASSGNDSSDSCMPRDWADMMQQLRLLHQQHQPLQVIQVEGKGIGF